MRLRTIIVLILAIICGGSAATGVVMMQGRIPKAENETVKVAVAASSIGRGQVITKAMVTDKDWPKSLVPKRAAPNSHDLIGRTVISPIVIGEPIVVDRLAEKDAGSGIAALIPHGYRAYTIQTKRIAANVAGFVMPGHRVDVLLTLRGGRDDDTGGGSSTTLLQAVDILAVNGLLQPPVENHVDPQDLESVTLLVTPDQAAKLDLGQNIGNLTLSLRNLDDIAESLTSPATVNLIRFDQQRPLMADMDEAGDASVIDQMLNALAQREPDAMDPADEKPRIATMRPPALEPVGTPELISTPVAESTLPEIEAIQTFRGRHTGRVLVRSNR